MDPVIRYFAAGAHAACGQTYGGVDYVHHLDDVVAILHAFGFRGEDFIQAGYLHDVIEDTQITAEVLFQFEFKPRVVDAVVFLSDEKGHNRKTRKANTYKRVREDIEVGGDHIVIGLAVKWADRIANLRMAKEGHRGFLQMYRKEQEAFSNAYMPPPTMMPDFEDILAEYDRLLK